MALATAAVVPAAGRFMMFYRVPCRAHLFVADGFLDAAEREHVVAVAAARQAAPADCQGKRDHTGFSFEMVIGGDCVLQRLKARVAATLDFANAAGSSFRFRRYAGGEFHPPHTDTFRIGDAHLVATAMMWLADTEAGGETLFPAADPAITLLPRAGRLALWLNCRPDGSADPAAAHQALPVRAGSKATLTEFVYGDPRRPPAVAQAPLLPDSAGGVIRAAHGH